LEILPGQASALVLEEGTGVATQHLARAASSKTNRGGEPD